MLVKVLGLVEISSMPAARRRQAELLRLGRAAPESAPPPPLVGELILIADRIADLAVAPAEQAEISSLLAWLCGRIEALLASCEVATVLDTGAVDFLRHEVVSDRPAPRDDLVDHIATTVRPGYRWRDVVLRAQQVVAYVDPDT